MARYTVEMDDGYQNLHAAIVDNVATIKVGEIDVPTNICFCYDLKEARRIAYALNSTYPSVGDVFHRTGADGWEWVPCTWEQLQRFRKRYYDARSDEGLFFADIKDSWNTTCKMVQEEMPGLTETDGHKIVSAVLSPASWIKEVK